MQNMNLRIYILAIISIMTLISQAREITGKVTGENDAPLEFVNVAIYRDSTFVTGTITDKSGNFTVNTDNSGHLTATISLIGYDTQSVAIPSSGDLGTVHLAPSSVELGEVVVKAARPATALKGNALVTSVEGSSLALAGTANDVLARVPMVIYNDGTPEVFGKGTPEIYINGRKVNDLTELKQLNSHDIKNVEVITNPGAAYSAEVKSVIRIRTLPPKGDGWSASLRTDNGFQHDFRTGNTLDLKYRTGGLEIFANYGWWHGYNFTDRTDDMTTTTQSGKYLQKIRTTWKERYNDMNGKIGFSWLINERHSIGAYYRNGWNRHSMNGGTPTEMWLDGALTEFIDTKMDSRSDALPLHSANLYYNGAVGKLGIDFNADYLWTKQRQESNNNEMAETGSDRMVITGSDNRNRMFAEKLVLSYPVGKGKLELGEEYTDTRSTNLFSSNIPGIGDSDNRVDESNIAAFIEVGQQLGRFDIGLGVRYEHVKYDYYEMGVHQGNQSRRYDNLFPSLNLSTRLGNVNMGLNYTGKTVRPGYGQLDGTISYINRLTYETGNPYLKPTKIHTVEYMAQWKNFFVQLSYSYLKDGVYHITEPFGADMEATLIKTANLNHKHDFSVFAGGQFKVGAWQPRVNAGLMKQWLTLPVNGEPTKMNTPGFMIQWQNAIRLPFDIWLNVDAQVMTPAWDNNMKITNTPWSVNAKVYKGFFNNSLGITLEAKDLFDTSGKVATLYSDAVILVQKNFSPNRSVMLTLQYRFNTTRDRYRGTGAGNSEKSRF